MCFSATASLIAGGALTAAGVATIRKTETKAELPFASIPLLFGIQQITEGVIWLSFGSPLLNIAMTYVYSMFSHVLWPIFVPIAILLLEKDLMRKKVLHVFSGIGLAVGIFLFYFILTDWVTSEITSNSIAYISPHLYLPLVMTLYVLATCGSWFVSSHKIINIFGVVFL